jgi:hypothetical protein
MHLTRHPKPATAYRITTARKSVPDDQAYWVRGYVISMSIRIVCFVLAVVTSGVLRWTFVACALIIPYLAVVFANGGREPNEDPPDTLGKFSPQLGGPGLGGPGLDGSERPFSKDDQPTEHDGRRPRT